MYSSNGEFFANRQATRAEREVYSYIRCLARLEDSVQAIDGFYKLLWQGVVTHPEFDSNAVRNALMSIIDSSDADEIMPYVINRCFYTIGNPWRMDNHRHPALRTLVEKASQLPERPKSRQVKQLVGAMEAYISNENLYVPLQRQMRLLSDEVIEKNVSFGDCFKDYFFIYESAAATRDIPVQHRKTIQLQRQKKAQELHQQLNVYWQVSRQGTQDQIFNPTRLGHTQLNDAICTFHPQRKGGYRHQAQTFEAGVSAFRTTGDFVDPFYDYIMEPLLQVDEQYGRNNFSKLVKNVLIDAGGKGQTPLTGISINQMCTRLLKLLVSNTIERPETAHFKKLVTTAGAKTVTAILLKIVLFRRTIRSWFEDRFGILFHMQESCALDKVAWLVESFEYMNVALALNAPWVNYTPRPTAF
ncbi:hypothetical protein [Leptothoe sp. PORK10 BA2]|uniref:hypothetical protein n=1 Tax=Leptothoe sp. PORK10 BA2 TaxID=3110254 RepID=UPI002B2154E3|nr:hypothetical protein [Leptothoe sp. PORK10 BA2]MEA5467083.1 hypothetical protein [Leptothoe sp. PORK10 BA2]